MADKPTLEWTALEYEHKERSVDWFWALGIITVSSAIVAIILGDYLFAVFIILAAFVLGMMALRKPEIVLFRITPQGLVLGRDTYTYDQIKSFYILEKEQGENVLLVMSNRSVVPLLTVPLGSLLPDEVRSVLVHYVPEERHEEPTAHKIMEYLGL